MTDLAFSAADRNPVVAAFVRSQGIAPGSLVLDVHAEDEMLGFAQEALGGDFDAIGAYLVAGRDVAATIRQLVLWKHGGFARLGAMLDFASGYGRVTRWLRRELAPERLWVSDIYAGAVDFQRRCFGVNAFESAVRPQDLAAPRRFDFIFVASLFTHLPRPSFEAWLSRLVDLLEPGGLLVFSVHDAELRELGRDMPADGFLFRALSESRTLDPEQYGSTWVSEAYVRDAVERLAPGAGCSRLARGLCHFQDLYLVAPQGADFAGLAFDGGPEGVLERVEARNGTLYLRGWAASLAPGGRIAEVRAGIAGAGDAVAHDFYPHAGVGSRYPQLGAAPNAAWSLELALDPRTRFSEAVLVVEAMSERGIATTLHLGSVESALRRSSEWDLRLAIAAQQQAEARRERAELEARRQALAAEALAARVAAMEASFFWRLRNRWFALKRALRLTDER
ncbi:MAG: class I SAM-dependent methyltransferase [Acidobacteriota bacterium]